MSTETIAAEIATWGDLPIAERITRINAITTVLHAIHPIPDPVSAVQWVPADSVQANNYNPNSVMPPEMRLLHRSIQADGYTQPIVVYWDEEAQHNIVVDGFHRNRIGKEFADIRAHTHGYLPIVAIHTTREERIASTIRHNRARGKHAVTGMVDIVVALAQAGQTDEEIGQELGMDADEVLRLKRDANIPDLFRHRHYSRSWVLGNATMSEDSPAEGEE